MKKYTLPTPTFQEAWTLLMPITTKHTPQTHKKATTRPEDIKRALTIEGLKINIKSRLEQIDYLTALNDNDQTSLELLEREAGI